MNGLKDRRNKCQLHNTQAGNFAGVAKRCNSKLLIIEGRTNGWMKKPLVGLDQTSAE